MNLIFSANLHSYQLPGFSIGPTVYPLNVIEIKGIDDFIPARGGVIAGKIPVAHIIRTSLGKVVNALINDLNFSRAIVRF